MSFMTPDELQDLKTDPVDAVEPVDGSRSARRAAKRAARAKRRQAHGLRHRLRWSKIKK